VSSQSQLVEGGNPYWLVTPTQPAENSVASDALMIDFPDSASVIQSVLMIAAVWHGGEDVLGYLMDTENLTLDGTDGDVRVIAPYYELSDEGVRYLGSKMSPRVKLAFTMMDEMCLVDGEVVETLRGLGFHVDLFVRQAQLRPASN
jgi:hypothetical protein